MMNSKTIGVAEDEKVTIIEKFNNKYYKVKSGNVIGYISVDWFKK